MRGVFSAPPPPPPQGDVGLTGAVDPVWTPGVGLGPRKGFPKTDGVLEHLVGDLRRQLERREPESAVAGILEGPGEGDLELAAPVGWGRVDEIGGGHLEGGGDLAHETELGFDVAVLELGQVGHRSADRPGEVGQGPSPTAPMMADPPPQHEGVEAPGVGGPVARPGGARGRVTTRGGVDGTGGARCGVAAGGRHGRRHLESMAEVLDTRKQGGRRGASGMDDRATLAENRSHPGHTAGDPTGNDATR